MINSGPAIPAYIPPSLKSDCCIMPVLKAIALGGVDTGRNNAQLAQRPITVGNKAGLSPPHNPAAGMRIAAAAVLLIILEAKTVVMANIMTIIVADKFMFLS